MRVYLDSAIVIYLVENVEPFVSGVRRRLSAPDTRQICSDLTRLECLVRPLREGDPILQAEYKQYFTSIATEVLHLSPDIMDRAAGLRAQYNFATPDAIHLAAAIIERCDVFLTNDHRLSRCPDIRVEIV